MVLQILACEDEVKGRGCSLALHYEQNCVTALHGAQFVAVH